MPEASFGSGAYQALQVEVVPEPSTLALPGGGSGRGFLVRAARGLGRRKPKGRNDSLRSGAHIRGPAVVLTFGSREANNRRLVCAPTTAAGISPFWEVLVALSIAVILAVVARIPLPAILVYGLSRVR